METPAATPCPAPAPAPKPARTAWTMPAGIAALLHTLRILLTHGRHLAEIAPDRIGKPDFNAVTACFGTNRMQAILAHIQRGLMRAVALERVLHERAASGRDIDCVGSRAHRFALPREPAEPANAPPAEPADPSADPSAAAAAQAAHKPARLSRPRHSNDPEIYMPTMEELEAQVRRRSIGRTIVDICGDLAVSPRFCARPFWNELFDTIRAHGGSIVDLMKARTAREAAFIKEQDKAPNSNWDWMDLETPQAFRDVLGRFIGEMFYPPEPLPSPDAFAAAMATGPP